MSETRKEGGDELESRGGERSPRDERGFGEWKRGQAVQTEEETWWDSNALEDERCWELLQMALGPERGGATVGEHKAAWERVEERAKKKESRGVATKGREEEEAPLAELAREGEDRGDNLGSQGQPEWQWQLDQY